MKTRSAKNKGQRASKEVKDALLALLPLENDDVQVVPSGVTGEDLKLSPAARKMLPFCFEVKNQEKLNIWDAFKQAESHRDKAENSKDLFPILAFKRNRSDLMVCMNFEDFLELVYERKLNVRTKKETYEWDEKSRDIHLP